MTSTEGEHGPDVTSGRWTRRLAVWRSPEGQPAWVRPLLLVVAALSALAYSWHTASTIEIYYAASVRSMSQSWHDFVFAGFDPAGTVTIDKLPGALWLQALSVRLFGFHVWAIMLPQAVEGAITVLVLFHCVRRLAGPLAGLSAAVVLAASPATVTLDRGNVPDTLMVLLLVLAADSTVTAILTGRWRSAVMAGVWVALAFQAKMIEAWLVLPSLGVAYLVAGRPAALVARVGRVAVLGVTAGVLSVSYMTFVTLTPSSRRPYVDGSATDSIFHQVFVYNGLSRVGQASPNALLGRTLGTALFTLAEPAPKWDRLLTGSYGHDTGWLLPAAFVVLVAVLVFRWREPRADLPRAGLLLWGLWLVTLCVVFTVSTTMNSYYAGALSPALAGVLGIGVALGWQHRHRPAVLLVSSATVLVTVGFAAWLLPPTGTGLPSWLAPAVVVLGLAAAAVLAAAAWAARRRGGEARGSGSAATRRSAPWVASSALPPSSSFRPSPVDRSWPLGSAPSTRPSSPSGSPRRPGRSSPLRPRSPAWRKSSGCAEALRTCSRPRRRRWRPRTSTSRGRRSCPLGGYTGTEPAPSARAVASSILEQKFHLALVASPGASPGARYVYDHCVHVPQPKSQPTPALTPKLRIYYCQP